MAVETKKTVLTRYLVVKVNIEVTGDFPEAENEILDTVGNELDYGIVFDQAIEVESGENVPVKIVGTEVLGLLEENPA